VCHWGQNSKVGCDSHPANALFHNALGRVDSIAQLIHFSHFSPGLRRLGRRRVWRTLQQAARRPEKGPGRVHPLTLFRIYKQSTPRVQKLDSTAEKAR
jgi:hypothetical protein